ncbi:MAG: hypothetical protein ABSD44_09845, partial [Terracidiphilus sp.]
VSVGTVKKSIAAMDSRWLLRNAAHRFAGSGLRGAFLIQRNTNQAATPVMNYVYDAATCYGTAMQNAAGNLAEAYTGTSSAKTTDLCFSKSI